MTDAVMNQYLVYSPMSWTRTIYAKVINGITEYGRETIEQVKERNPDHSFEVVSEEELNKRLDDYEKSLITDPLEITRERYWEMLEVLPPCKWRKRGCWEMFHISERLTGNLVSWFATDGDKYYEFTDQDCASDLHLIKKVGG